MSSRNFEERRAFPRVPYGAWVEEEGGGGLGFYLARNLSGNGILLRSKTVAPPMGRTVRLRLVIENEARVMSLSGVVVRHSTDGSGEFAVHFSDLDPERVRFMQELVRELSGSAADMSFSDDLQLEE